MAAGCWVATLLQSVDVTIDSVDCFFGWDLPTVQKAHPSLSLSARTCAPMGSPVERLRRLGKCAAALWDAVEKDVPRPDVGCKEF